MSGKVNAFVYCILFWYENDDALLTMSTTADNNVIMNFSCRDKHLVALFVVENLLRGGFTLHLQTTTKQYTQTTSY